ncbi:formin homology 2 domain-containing protein / FH2domain-containing protein [Striga asiatica]|uniref:Formin homology 2 domain-containing protein / FH2domain-containing protein n=1 Tax=Striga asiatica TaxID=4170 RepID=A0A5A7PQ43_STRAF|nr:formin homology 2 domain-containing protein / FH2domain-containing protein [Striga asiatica]
MRITTRFKPAAYPFPRQCRLVCSNAVSVARKISVTYKKALHACTPVTFALVILIVIICDSLSSVNALLYSPPPPPPPPPPPASVCVVISCFALVGKRSTLYSDRDALNYSVIINSLISLSAGNQLLQTMAAAQANVIGRKVLTHSDMLNLEIHNVLQQHIHFHANRQQLVFATPAGDFNVRDSETRMRLSSGAKAG